MLEHADAGDAVEGAGGVAVILQADLDAVGQARLPDAFRRQVELVLRQRDADAARAELLRRTDHQRAPAAADVEQGLSGLQPDLGQDVVDLLALGRGKVFIAMLEVGAGVHHARVQPEPVELVGYVVVILDRGLVRCLGVGEMLGHACQCAAGLRAGGSREAVSHGDDIAELAVQVDLLLDIGLAEVVQAGREQQGQGARLAYGQGHRRMFETAERILVAVP